MKAVGLILTEDKEIIKDTNTYSHIYKLVKQFVDRYDIQKRKIGSKLSFWLHIDCNNKLNDTKYYGRGYYFETTIKENLIEHIAEIIVWRFEGSIEEIVENECSITIDRGL